MLLPAITHHASVFDSPSLVLPAGAKRVLVTRHLYGETRGEVLVEAGHTECVVEKPVCGMFGRVVSTEKVVDRQRRYVPLPAAIEYHKPSACRLIGFSLRPNGYGSEITFYWAEVPEAEA